MATINLGDRVMLKSGSPELTVKKFGTGTGPEKYVTVTWFNSIKQEFCETALLAEQVTVLQEAK